MTAPSEPLNSPQPEQSPRATHAEDYQDETVSIEPLLRILRNYRKVLAASVLVAGLGYVIVVLGLYLWLPRERFARLGFQPRFEGASLGRYPNDLPFSSADVIADRVVQAVYESNQLHRYGEFQNFQESLFVIESNPDLELLDADYRSRLADTKLAIVDRQRIEEEYRRKRETLRKVEFVLTIRENGRFARMPRDLVSKVLRDTLDEWARQAVEKKGVLKYDIAFPAGRLGATQLDRVTDVYAAIEALRQRALLLDRSIEKLTRLPGAGLVRVGERRLSLPDISNDIQRALRFYIEPLGRELVSDPAAAGLFQDALRAAVLNRDEAKSLLGSLQDSLRLYEQGTTGPGNVSAPSQGAQGSQSASGAVAPQVSESFLDRLVQLSTRAANQEYRQKLAERIIEQSQTAARLEKEAAFLKALAGTPSKSMNLSQAVLRLREAEKQIEASAADAIAAYDLISKTNLAPATALFAPSSPVSFWSESSLRGSQVLLWGVLFLVATLIAGVVVCSIYASSVSRG